MEVTIDLSEQEQLQTLLILLFGNPILYFSDALSVLEDDFNVNCRVYPNPSKAIIHVKVEHFKSASVHNIMGQKINLSGHESGIYLVKVKTSQGKTFVRKVVKN